MRYNVLKKTSNTFGTFRYLQSLYLCKPVSMLQTDFFICGLAPFRDQFQFILLCYEKSEVKLKINFVKNFTK